MELFDIYADEQAMDSLVPLRCPMDGDRAARGANDDHRMLVARDGCWRSATQEEFDAAVGNAPNRYTARHVNPLGHVERHPCFSVLRTRSGLRQGRRP